MKSAGKARSNGLYRHIRTSKEIIRNLLNDSTNIQRINPCIYDNSIQFLFHHSTLYQIVIQTF